jgi:hypothetical protein
MSIFSGSGHRKRWRDRLKPQGAGERKMVGATGFESGLKLSGLFANVHDNRLNIDDFSSFIFKPHERSPLKMQLYCQEVSGIFILTTINQPRFQSLPKLPTKTTAKLD